MGAPIAKGAEAVGVNVEPGCCRINKQSKHSEIALDSMIGREMPRILLRSLLCSVGIVVLHFFVMGDHMDAGDTLSICSYSSGTGDC